MFKEIKDFFYNLLTSENYHSDKQTRGDKTIYWIVIIAILVIVAFGFTVGYF